MKIQNRYGIYVIVCALLLLLQSPALCGSIVWPDALALPQSPDSIVLPTLSINVDQRLYVKSIVNRDSILYHKNTPELDIRQLVEYELRRDSWFGGTNQYLDVSGSVLRKKLFSPFFDAGFEWSPVSVMRLQYDQRAISGSLDVGPIAEIRLWDIPVKGRAGFAGKGWNEELPEDFNFGQAADNATGDLGAYAAVSINKPQKLLGPIPVYAHGTVFGRSMKTSKLLSSQANLLYAHSFNASDSLFIFGADTQTNGRDAFLGEDVDGKSRYINTLRHIWHSWQVAGGLKFAPRFYLKPQVLYSFLSTANGYPVEILKDDQNYLHMAQVSLETDTGTIIRYTGGLRFEHEGESRIPDWWNQATEIDSRLPDSIKLRMSGYDQLHELLDYTDRAREDSLQAMLGNYDRSSLAIDQHIEKYLESGQGFSYSFSYSGDYRIYPFYYYNGSDTTKSREDRHRINLRHKLELTPYAGAVFDVTIAGEYLIDSMVYHKKERSGANYEQQIYSVSTVVGVRIGDNWNLTHRLSASSRQKKYCFPIVHRGDYPPYSRQFGSSLKAVDRILPQCQVGGEWIESYDDDGYWNGREYADLSLFVDSLVSASFTEYYAIQYKTWKHTLSLFVNGTLFSGFRCGVGCQFKAVVPIAFSGIQYQIDEAGVSYSAAPYLKIQSSIDERIMVNGVLRRFLDSRFDDYWDMIIRISMEF